MKLLAVFIAVACFACAYGMPRYVAIPAEDIHFLEHGARVAREAIYDVPLRRVVRQAGQQADHHDYVDFGAHTGHHGAFGWYADFPVHTQEHQ